MLLSEALGIAAEQNIDASTGHVRCDRYRTKPSSLSDDDGLASVLFCVQHFVLDATLIQFARQQLALFDADRTDQNRLTRFVPCFDVVHHGGKLCCFRLVDEVGVVNSHHGTVSWNWHHLQAVCVHQFGCLGLSRSGHSAEFVVHAEVVLQRDCCKSLVFFFDLDALFGLYGLVNALTPSTTFKNSSCELVDDFYFAVLNDVVLVAVIQHGSFQSNLQLVDQVLLHFVVQVFDA